MLRELDIRKNMRMRVRSNSFLGIQLRSSSLSYTFVFGAKSFSTVLAESGSSNYWKFGGTKVRYTLPFQPVDATHAANRSAGVSKSNVLRGRSLSSLATQFRCACE